MYNLINSFIHMLIILITTKLLTSLALIPAFAPLLLLAPPFITFK